MSVFEMLDFIVKKYKKMQKTEKKKKKDKLAKHGKFWIHDPNMNYRQSSGVQYGGRYVTLDEYKESIRLKRLYEVVEYTDNA